MFYNENFERIILSTIIFDPAKLNDIIDQIKPHHFYLHDHQVIYQAMVDLYRENKPVDESYIDKKTAMKQQKALAEIMTANPAANIMPYSVDMAEMWAKREIRRLSTLIMQSVEADKSSEMMIAEIEHYVTTIQFAEESRARSFSKLKKEYIANPPAPIYSTGVSFIDEALNGGLEMGQLVLVSGDPEAGKTILTMQILKNITKHNNAVLFAFEFTTDSLVKLQMRVEGDRYENENLQIIDDGYDIVDIEREIKIWSKRGARFFVIDSQMRIENAANTGTMEDRESEKFSRLAKLSHRLNVVILLIIQNSKADAAASVISPMGTKKGAHEASIIMHLKRLKDDPENGKKEMRELIFSKNKQTGQHFKGEVAFDPRTLMFTRPYERAETTEYNGHNIPVEHKDAKGKTTHKGTFEEALQELDDSDKIDMAVL